MALRHDLYMCMRDNTLCECVLFCFKNENTVIRTFASRNHSFKTQFMYAGERTSPKEKTDKEKENKQTNKTPLSAQANFIHFSSPYMKVRLTDLVLPFYGEFHQQLLGIGADEDKWGGRLFTGIKELQGWGGQTKKRSV